MYIAIYKCKELLLDVPIPKEGLKAITTTTEKTFGYFEKWDDALSYLRAFYEVKDAEYFKMIDCSIDSLSITENKKTPNKGCAKKVYTSSRGEKQYRVEESLSVCHIEDLTGNNPFNDIQNFYD